MVDPYSLYTAIQFRMEYIQHDRKRHEPRLKSHNERLDELNMIFSIITTISEGREDDE